MSTTIATIEKKKTLFPALRFGEYNTEWIKSKIGDDCKVLMCKRIFAEQTSASQEIPFYKIGTVGGAPDAYISRVLFEEFRNKYNYPKKGEVLITCSGTVGKCIPFDGKDAYYQDSNIVWIDNPALKIRNEYLFYVLANFDWGKLNSTTISRIYGSDLRNLVVVHPKSVIEQQKIACFLTEVDEKIQLLNRKKRLLERYKKGVMQQLFSGKLRFKDENGKTYPAWEEKRLGDVSKIYDGTHQTPTYVKEGIPFYSVEHVTANQFSETKYISREVFEKENEKVRLEKGDILMTKIGDIGTARLIDWDVEASFYVSLALLKQSKFISAKYLNQYIASRNFQLELWKRIIHVAFPKKINLGEIGNCKVLVPIKQEQQKIASYLTSIDIKIESVASQIEQSQTFKKGLLQQMFV